MEFFSSLKFFYLVLIPYITKKMDYFAVEMKEKEEENVQTQSFHNVTNVFTLKESSKLE